MESMLRQSAIEGKNVERYLTEKQCLDFYKGDEEQSKRDRLRFFLAICALTAALPPPRFSPT